MTLALTMPFVPLWLSLLIMGIPKVEKASICLECADGTILENSASDTCISVNLDESSEDVEGFDDHEDEAITIIVGMFLGGVGLVICCAICRCLAADNEESNQRTYAVASSTRAGLNSNLVGTASRLSPPFIPSAFKDPRLSDQTARERTYPLLSAEVHEPHTFPIVVAEPDGSFQVAIKE